MIELSDSSLILLISYQNEMKSLLLTVTRYKETLFDYLLLKSILSSLLSRTFSHSAAKDHGLTGPIPNHPAPHHNRSQDRRHSRRSSQPNRHGRSSRTPHRCKLHLCRLHRLDTRRIPLAVYQILCLVRISFRAGRYRHSRKPHRQLQLRCNSPQSS